MLAQSSFGLAGDLGDMTKQLQMTFTGSLGMTRCSGTGSSWTDLNVEGQLLDHQHTVSGECMESPGQKTLERV